MAEMKNRTKFPCRKDIQPVEPEPQPELDPEPDPTAARLPFPLEGWSGSWYDAEGNITWTRHVFETQHYGIAEVPSQYGTGARHMPIYHDDTCAPEVGVCPDALPAAPLRRPFVGVDQCTMHIGELPQVRSHGDVDVRHGQLDDAVGRETAVAYLKELLTPEDPIRRYGSAPTLRLIGSASAVDARKVASAVQLVKAALPLSSRIGIGDAPPNLSLACTVDATGRRYVSGGRRPLQGMRAWALTWRT
ncbi:MAG: hypothetical protein OXP66_11535 [Candidatus Tectomicrobia bacterium]|nr:hypothetical protein [Candidatus Tectomicrobia bacterium]